MNGLIYEIELMTAPFEKQLYYFSSSCLLLSQSFHICKAFLCKLLSLALRVFGEIRRFRNDFPQARKPPIFYFLLFLFA